MKRRCSATVFAFWCCLSFAAPTSAPVRAEIEALLARLQDSGCQFNRKGSWYSAEQAKDHLLSKLEYIEGRGTVQSTEKFIELAASKSSSSGKPYHVKCGPDPSVESQQWLASTRFIASKSQQGKAMSVLARQPPNPSVKGTSCGKPQAAPYVER